MRYDKPVGLDFDFSVLIYDKKSCNKNRSDERQKQGEGWAGAEFYGQDGDANKCGNFYE